MLAPGRIYAASVVHIVDGDTLDLEAKVEDVNERLGFHIRVVRQTFFAFRIRLLARIRDQVFGIDAPERYTAEGRVATQFVRDFLPLGSPVLARTYPDPGDKYGRWLALVEREGVDLGASLLENGMAVRKYGAPPVATLPAA